MVTEIEETYWEKANRSKMGVYITNVEMQFIFNSKCLREGGLAVDVGAGAGRFSIPAAEIMNVVALDLDLHALKRLKFKNRNVEVIVADARFMPLKNGVADNVIMIELLDCVVESEAIISECSSVLKDDGVIFLSFGNKSSIKGKIKSFVGKPYLHSYKEILGILKSKKFKVVRRMGFNWLPFGRVSDSTLVSLFAKGERILGLRKLVRFSPWVIIQAVKTAEQNHKTK
ncbi:MAG: class I SAM-dependent methyltransferase [Candidatus Bathyarchaeia archaeon]